MSKIVIVDYSCGNSDSVNSAVKYHGFNSVITSDPEIIKDADKIILPGQGSFKTGVNNLKKYKLFDLIKSKAKKEKVPILGICLGMQILATVGFEDGVEKGLDLVPGKVDLLPETKLKLPHIGWNQIKIKQENLIFNNIKDQTDFYFVHSYAFICDDTQNILATTNYQDPFISSISNGNIYGVQFHPEKSLAAGLELIKNFIKL